MIEWFGFLRFFLVSERLGERVNYPYLDSYSNHTGAMVFNADFYTTGDSMAVPPPYPRYHAELISPSIDLRSVKNEVNVRFEQLCMKAGTQSVEFPSTTSFTFRVFASTTMHPEYNRAPKVNCRSNANSVVSKYIG